MKSKYFITLIFSLIVLQTSAQRYKFNLQEYNSKTFHFGFVLASTYMDFSLKPNTDEIGVVYSNIPNIDGDALGNASLYGVSSTPKTGFLVGIVGTYRLAEFFDLRLIPSLSFGDRRINYTFNENPNGLTPDILDLESIVYSTFIELPLQIRYKSRRAQNFQASVLAGLKVNINMSDPKSELFYDSGEDFSLRKDDLLYEFGVAFDFYFPFFKFGIELKSSYGTKELMLSEGSIYSLGISSLKSRFFQISLTFE